MTLLANAGVPMICVYWPSAWIMLLPIVLIEAWVGTRLLKTSFIPCLKAATAGNLVSTLVGIPATWLVLALLEMHFSGSSPDMSPALGKLYAVTLEAPWLGPAGDDLYWMIPVAALVLSVPFYVVSVLTEAPIARWFLPDVSRQDIFRWTRWGNTASYACIVLLVIAMCTFDGLGHWLLGPFAPLTDPMLTAVSTCNEWLAQLIGGD
jgi:hypothetical protein